MGRGVEDGGVDAEEKAETRCLSGGAEVVRVGGE